MELLTDSARHLQGLGDRELQRVLALSRADSRGIQQCGQLADHAT